MNPIIAIDELSHAGYATAVATLQTAIWAGQQQSPDAYFDCFAPEIKVEFQNARAKEAERAKCDNKSQGCSCGSEREQLRGIRVFAQHIVSDHEVELEYELEVAGGANTRCRQPFRMIGNAWKISGPPQEVR
jgi:hypothetical protein